jgi:hypothetical protein
VWPWSDHGWPARPGQTVPSDATNRPLATSPRTAIRWMRNAAGILPHKFSVLCNVDGRNNASCSHELKGEFTVAVE